MAAQVAQTATIATADPNFPVRFPKLQSAWDISSVISFLEDTGLCEPNDENMRNGLLIALCHESYLYEHAEQLSEVTKGLLQALGAVGQAFIARAAAIYLYERSKPYAPLPFRYAIGQLLHRLPDWAVTLDWLIGSAALGKGLDRAIVPPRIPVMLFRRVLGVLCLLGMHGAANSLLEKFLSASQEEVLIAIGNPQRRVRDVLGRAAPSTQTTTPHLGHPARFIVTLTDTQGRRASGEGPNEAKAKRRAYFDFIRVHLQDPHRPGYVQCGPSPSPLLGPDIGLRIQAIRSIRDAFQLPTDSPALLSQALMDSSWSPRNFRLIAAAHQQDNQVLAFLGADVLTYDHALRAAAVAFANPPEQFTFLTLTRESYERAFHLLRLEGALLYTQVRHSSGITLDMASDAFTAVAAAIYLCKRCPPSLLREWPANLIQLRDIVMPPVPRANDSSTLLQQICGASQLKDDYSFQLSGLGSTQQASSILTLHSQVMNMTFKVAGSPVGNGTTKAKQQVATIVLEAFDTLADQRPLANIAQRSGTERTLAIFLLAHLARRATVGRIPLQRWARMSLFGAHLAGDSLALSWWADDADKLLRNSTEVPREADLFVDFFRSAIAVHTQQSRRSRQYLGRSLDWIDGLENARRIEDRDLLRVVQLCDFYRALGSSDPDISLSQVASDWQSLYGSEVRVLSQMPEAYLDRMQRAALDAIASIMLRQAGLLELRVTSDSPLVIRICCGVPLTSEEYSAVLDLWSRASSTLTISVKRDCVEFQLQVIRCTNDSGALAKAVATAVYPVAMPYDGAVADVLHDLKNQLIAARQALTTHVSSRTGRLVQEAKASEHLDRALAFARRLRAVSSLLAESEDEPRTELGSFMRHYAGELFASLPSSISLTVESSENETVMVSLDTPSLTAILGNLVKNATEAMPSGGAIRLGWTSDAHYALVEVSDTGPGLPDHVVRALASGERVLSAKPGGNGLGLSGVQVLLRRSGGELSSSSTSSGTTWWLTLPLFLSEGEER